MLSAHPNQLFREEWPARWRSAEKGSCISRESKFPDGTPTRHEGSSAFNTSTQRMYDHLKQRLR